MDYMSSEESEYEDEEDVITGEKERKLVAYRRKKFPWERTNLTKLKEKLDKAHRNNLTPHAKAMVQLGLSGRSELTDQHCYLMLTG